MTYGDDIEILSYGEPPEPGSDGDGTPPPDRRRRRLLTAAAVAAVAVVAVVEYAPWSSSTPTARHLQPGPTPSVFAWLDGPNAQPTLTAQEFGGGGGHSSGGLGTVTANYTISTPLLDPVTIVGFTAQATGAVPTMAIVGKEATQATDLLKHPVTVIAGHPVEVAVYFDVHQPGCRSTDRPPTLTAFVTYHGHPTDRVDFAPADGTSAFEDSFEQATGCGELTATIRDAPIPVGAPVIQEPRHGTGAGDLGRLPIDQSVVFGVRCSRPSTLTFMVGTEQPPLPIACSDTGDNTFVDAPRKAFSADVRVSAPRGVTWSVAVWRDPSAR